MKSKIGEFETEITNQYKKLLNGNENEVFQFETIDSHLKLPQVKQTKKEEEN